MELPSQILDEVQALNWLALSRDFWGELFEEMSMAVYAAAISPGDVAADCGVNMGVHARAMARACTTKGRVFAFEPAPVMMEKAQAASLGLEQIAWVQKALWEKSDETLTFHFYPVKHGLSTLRHREDITDVERLDVLTTTLDDAMAEPPVLMKLDVEGAEYHALLGAERIMREGLPIIIFEGGRQESADRYGYTPEQFFDLFYSRGYFLFTIAGMPFTPQLWDNPMTPWQFMAIHPGSPRLLRAFGAINQRMQSLQVQVRRIADLRP